MKLCIALLLVYSGAVHNLLREKTTEGSPRHSPTRGLAGAVLAFALGAATLACESESESKRSVDANVVDNSPDAAVKEAGSDAPTQDARPGDTNVGADAAGGTGGAGGAGGCAPPVIELVSLDPDGDGAQPSITVVSTTIEGESGWKLAFIKNSVHVGEYDQFGKGYVSVEALTSHPQTTSSNATGTPALAGWLDLNTLPFTNLRLAGYRNGCEVFASKPIPKTSLRIDFGQDGYLLYGEPHDYFWCGGKHAYTTTGVGQVNRPTDAPAGCKHHSSLGNGWDFGTAQPNQGLTLCGSAAGASKLMTASPGGGFISYPTPGAAQAIWVK